MYLVVNHKNVIIEISETIGEQKISGNILVHNGSLAIAKNQVKAVYDVEVPDEVMEAKYCYTPEKGFYENKNYVEPYNGKEEIEKLKAKKAELEEQITEIQLAMVEMAESEV